MFWMIVSIVVLVAAPAAAWYFFRWVKMLPEGDAKKYAESGRFGGKGSDAHEATGFGDTVGDPFNDTAYPSLNTQITVVSLLSSLRAGRFVAAPLIG
jgi:Na+/H+-translocating membrane pyrophosphatase